MLAAADRHPGRTLPGAHRPLGRWGLAAVTVTSLGGPLALAAQMGPGIVAGAPASAGLEMVAGAVVFGAPVAIWLRYARDVSGPAGLTGFVEAAAGRPIALVQAGLWTVSYLLYLLYTTESIVYDVLPTVFPGVGPYQPALEIAIPVALAAVMIAGWRTTIAVTGIVAAGQLAIAAVLAGVTIAGLSPSLGSFGAGSPAGPLAESGAQTALLYVCAGLPLFLGGEVRREAHAMRWGLLVGYLVTAAVLVAAVYPFAADPALANGVVPGVDVAQRFAGHGFAVAVGVGVAVSSAGVILMEYLALTRLTHAVTAWRVRPVTVVIGAIMVAAAPLSLIDPAAFYSDLLHPSMIALWASQAIVFAVYPRYARRRGWRVWPAVLLAVVGVGLAGYGLSQTVPYA